MLERERRDRKRKKKRERQRGKEKERDREIERKRNERKEIRSSKNICVGTKEMAWLRSHLPPFSILRPLFSAGKDSTNIIKCKFLGFRFDPEENLSIYQY